MMISIPPKYAVSQVIGAAHRAAYFYSVWVLWDPNHDAVIRIGGEAPGWRVHFPYGGYSSILNGLAAKPCQLVSDAGSGASSWQLGNSRGKAWLVIP
jgi:hypothetical protein